MPYTVAGGGSASQCCSTHRPCELELPSLREFGVVEVDVPGELVRALNRLAFRYADTAMRSDALRSGDLGRLAVAFRSFTFTPLQ